ncbi:MAG: DUF58 domain-containing protein [Nitrospinaceae bacterium]|nr:DUF58 domain-containing protein [Nitrospinaceae bacterium]NIR56071.1 DUF58 domain-containing protein [Nitrospinaceae bacterium]NIS86516.1 DUF58 domain-containing protein [Nitrospinaceae bacterium]NIT83354.1 DUF58 domain-containing protein [Nitrospinaceae bacterium]NIU45560.1 DUF58 domain-containing protein [Nitrospinaceae bacterium]
MNASAKPLFTLTLGNRVLCLTRDGGGFILLTLGVGLGAINTGNNLLYLILAMCCSFIGVSGILSDLSLKQISIQLDVPKTFYAQDPTPVQVRVMNGKNWLPSYSLRVSLAGRFSSRLQVDRDVYLFRVPPGGSAEKTVMLTALKRGPLRIRSGSVSTGFPFGFFEKTLIFSLEAEALVYPPIHSVPLPDPSSTSAEGEGIVQQRGEEVFALREFRPGDEKSAVHWKSSAKTGDLRIKEFWRGGAHSYTLFLNLIDPQTNLRVPADVMEKRVSECASLAYHLMARGDEVSLKTLNRQTPFGNTEAHLDHLMRVLARIGLPGSDRAYARG